jgi:hypothetical protein
MPPVALVLATHLLLQQGVWRRQHTAAGAMGERPGKGATSPSVDGSRRPTRDALRQPQPEPTARGGPSPLPGASLQRQPADAATRKRARQLYLEAQAAGRKLTGAEPGRALGTSDSYGRLLLREFRTSSTAADNGTPREG